MAHDGVNASPADLRRLAKALTTYRNEVTAAGRKVSGALQAAQWHDSKKDAFEAKYRELEKALDRFMSQQAADLAKGLNEYASRLEHVRDTRM